MLADFFTKALQGSLFAKFHDMIMGWKHVDTLQMGPPSTKERVGNVVNVSSNQEENESKMETGGEIIESSVVAEGDRTGYNVKTKENGTKMYPQRGDEGKRKINAQVLCGHSLRIRHGTT